MFRLFVLTLSFCLVPGCTARTPPAPVFNQAEAGPAFWTVSDADTKITMLGTIHLLPKTLDWKRPELMQAFEDAKILYLEVDASGVSDAERTEITALMRARPDETLDKLLPADDWLALIDAAQKYDVSPKYLKQQTPWSASFILSRVSLEALGYMADLGADEWLDQSARERGIEVRGLEPYAAASRKLAALPPEVQTRMLRQSVDDLETLDADFHASVSAWAEGRVDDLYDVSMAEMARDLPEVYQVLLVGRNEDWLPEIERILREETGDVFIAVGAGHLIGERGLVAVLRSRGWNVRQF